MQLAGATEWWLVYTQLFLGAPKGTPVGQLASQSQPAAKIAADGRK